MRISAFGKRPTGLLAAEAGRNLNAAGAVPICPSEFSTLTLTLALGSAAVSTTRWFESTNCSDNGGILPNLATAPGRKLLPNTVTTVPPSLHPVLGDTTEIAGAGKIETFNENPVE